MYELDLYVCFDLANFHSKMKGTHSTYVVICRRIAKIFPDNVI